MWVGVDGEGAPAGGGGEAGDVVMRPVLPTPPLPLVTRIELGIIEEFHSLCVGCP